MVSTVSMDWIFTGLSALWWGFRRGHIVGMTYLGIGPEYDLTLVGPTGLGLYIASTCVTPADTVDCGVSAGGVTVDCFRPALLYLWIPHLSKRDRYARILKQQKSVKAVGGNK